MCFFLLLPFRGAVGVFLLGFDGAIDIPTLPRRWDGLIPIRLRLSWLFYVIDVARVNVDYNYMWKINEQDTKVPFSIAGTLEFRHFSVVFGYVLQIWWLSALHEVWRAQPQEYAVVSCIAVGV